MVTTELEPLGSKVKVFPGAVEYLKVVMEYETYVLCYEEDYADSENYTYTETRLLGVYDNADVAMSHVVSPYWYRWHFENEEVFWRLDLDDTRRYILYPFKLNAKPLFLPSVK